MKPESISEKLMYSTVRLQTNTGSGTGFFFSFQIGDRLYPTIITNQHVVNYKEVEEVEFYLHLSSSNGEPDGNFKVKLKTHWFFHSSKDLCFTFINPIFDEVEHATGKSVYYTPIDATIVPTEEQLKKLSAIEKLVMVGYPIGLWDERNKLPIFRQGNTAAHPAIDFNKDGEGLADMACFPGSSGSPIFIINEGGYQDKLGNIILGKSRIYFMGVLHEGPAYNAKGEIVIANIPTTQPKIESRTPIMTNLGYYTKSKEINEFNQVIEKFVNEYNRSEQ